MYKNIDIKKLNNYEKKEQLEYLMLRFGKKIVKIAYYYVRDIYQAEDICQEVFIKIYKNAEKFRGDSSYYTWIYRITINLCKDYVKSAVVRKILPFASIKDVDRIRDKTNSLIENIEGGETFNKVMELPVKYRVPVSLHYFEGYSTIEIAGILKISESNVRVRLHRGREKLKGLLTEEAEK